MEDMMPKVKELRDQFPELDIEVDGGVTPVNAAMCELAGANLIVSGTGIFAAKDRAAAIKTIRESVQN